MDESQYQDFAILNDPIALEQTLKDQYNQTKQWHNAKDQLKSTIQQSDDSVRPLSALDDSVMSSVKSVKKLQPLNLQLKTSLHESRPSKGSDPWSELLDPSERKKVFNAGQSIDSKRVTEALGFIDMKQMCYCLAQALMKHIDFGKGFYFLQDLQNYIDQVPQSDKKKLLEDSTESRNPYRINNDKLEFTYDLGELPLHIPERKDKPYE